MTFTTHDQTPTPLPDPSQPTLTQEVGDLSKEELLIVANLKEELASKKSQLQDCNTVLPDLPENKKGVG